MLDLISLVVEGIFILMVLFHMLIVNKSISRLEEKFEELDDEVFKKYKEEKEIQEKEVKEVALETTAQITTKKKRVRKPKAAKEL
jgi:Na+-transporting methylmalonyl-CoA/oxaloacetate decarboxylase gamma subunit